MVETTAAIRNRDGIHCRPSTVIIKAVEAYDGEVLVSNGSGEADLRSIFGLMALGLLPGDRVTIRVEGPDEAGQAARLKELFETHFDFPPRAKAADGETS